MLAIRLSLLYCMFGLGRGARSGAAPGSLLGNLASRLIQRGGALGPRSERAGWNLAATTFCRLRLDAASRLSGHGD